MTNVDAGRYLSGPFAPVADEVTLTDLEVHGTLPGHLDGRFLRNGPNPFADTDPASYHWFLGEGMVHGLRLFRMVGPRGIGIVGCVPPVSPRGWVSSHAPDRCTRGSISRRTPT